MVSALGISDYRLPTHHTPLAAELLGPLESWALGPFLLAFGWLLPRGKGPVITVEGFLSHKFFMSPLNLVLQSLGYTVHDPGFSINRGCPDRNIDRLVSQVESAAEQSGELVSIVGHSLGGTYGVLATERTDLIRTVICLGSPLSKEAKVHPVLSWAHLAERVRASWSESCSENCFTSRCSCRFGQCMASGEIPESETSIYTVSSVFDGMVKWEATVHPDPARSTRILGTHNFMPHNPLAIVEVARRLASG